MSLYDKLSSLAPKAGQSGWATRIVSELNFAAQLSTAKKGAYDDVVEKAADALIAAADAEGGVITKSAAESVEQMLMPLSAVAKSYRVHCISHAHIDMNWMWGFQETASITVDTFRTVLDLMKSTVSMSIILLRLIITAVTADFMRIFWLMLM